MNRARKCGFGRTPGIPPPGVFTQSTPRRMHGVIEVTSPSDSTTPRPNLSPGGHLEEISAPGLANLQHYN